MKISSAALLILSLFSFGCGKDQSSSQPSGSTVKTPVAVDLSQMTLADALVTKYSSAILTCNLWTRMRGPLIVTDTPDSSKSFNLLVDPTFPKDATLSAKSGIHSLKIQISMSAIHLQTYTYGDDYGARYRFKNSPVIEATISGQTGTLYPDEYVGGTFDGKDVTIGENISETLVSESSGPHGELSPTVNYVECTISTRARAGFEDEWRQDAIGDEPTCLLGQPADPRQCMIRRNKG